MNDPATPGKPCTGPLCLGQVRPLIAFGHSVRDGHQARCKDCCAELRRVSDAAARAAVFGHYGTSCACCAATEDLSIDHVNGDGAEHRAELFGNERSAGVVFYRWLIAERFPPGYQTMCRPCNRSKGDGPACRLDHAVPVGSKRCIGRCGQVKDLGQFSAKASRCQECRCADERDRRAAKKSTVNRTTNGPPAAVIDGGQVPPARLKGTPR